MTIPVYILVFKSLTVFTSHEYYNRCEENKHSSAIDERLEKTVLRGVCGPVETTQAERGEEYVLQPSLRKSEDWSCDDE